MTPVLMGRTFAAAATRCVAATNRLNATVLRAAATSCSSGSSNAAASSLSCRTYRTRAGSIGGGGSSSSSPGSVAFADCETAAITDLFLSFSKSLPDGGIDDEGEYLCLDGVRELLASIGERPDDFMLRNLFEKADLNQDGKLHLEEFLMGADAVLGDAPARIVLVVGGPGSGKGLLCQRLSLECGVVHMSSGDLLRDEVERNTPLGRECADIMARGDLVSSAVMTTLIRRRMRAFPGRRVLLDGFPRSLENAQDFAEICGKPELALHLDCDDTVLMERIIKRGRDAAPGAQRSDDNIDTALTRLRTYHKYHHPTLEWLREQHCPIVNLDCSGTPDNVWKQLLAIGRLMRPAASHGAALFPFGVEDDSPSDNKAAAAPPSASFGS